MHCPKRSFVTALIFLILLFLGVNTAWAGWYFNWSSGGQSGKHGSFNTRSSCESQRSSWSHDLRMLGESASSNACYQRGGSSGSYSGAQSGAYALGEGVSEGERGSPGTRARWN